MSKQADFKATLDRAVDLAVAWREDGAKLPAVSPATADELRQAFDIELPDEGLGGAATIERLGRSAKNGLCTNTHPNFYA